MGEDEFQRRRFLKLTNLKLKTPRRRPESGTERSEPEAARPEIGRHGDQLIP
jgi:hypothetical protein